MRNALMRLGFPLPNHSPEHKLMLLSVLGSDTSPQPMDMDSEPGQPSRDQDSQKQRQEFESAAVQAKCVFDYAWKYAMAANGQPIAVR